MTREPGEGPERERVVCRVRVVGVLGSLREGSSTSLAVERALEGARTLGAETRLLDLRDDATAA